MQEITKTSMEVMVLEPRMWMNYKVLRMTVESIFFEKRESNIAGCAVNVILARIRNWWCKLLDLFLLTGKSLP